VQFGGLSPERNAYFESHNRNKRGIVLDLKHAEGREVLLRLAETADVFVQNMRQGVLERLGLSYADLKARNPAIIYASASGYGAKGPQRTWAALDILGQARSGFMMSQGAAEDPPTVSFSGLADQVGAFALSYGILMALWHRARTGEGQEVNASLLGSMIALQSFNITNVLFGGAVQRRRSRLDSEALWNSYPCRDGGWISLAMTQTDRWWKPFCAAINRPDMLTDERFSRHRERLRNRGALIQELDRVFAERDQAEWVTYLAGECGLPVSAVQDYSQLGSDPQVLANEYVVPYPDDPERVMVGPLVQLSASPGSIRSPAPEFGQHTEEVLAEAGFSWEEIDRLRSAGAIGPR
jgi:crotonobetainyl-CoA:carnitine CoA-transferase CaiB-like acyl-CoA transferase